MKNIKFKKNGYIFDIQGFSLHDGPGSRTLIFFNGCSMRCKWCSNPEGQYLYPVPMYRASKCIHDTDCLESCPFHAISISNNLLKIDRKKCKNCKTYSCDSACCTGALKISGYKRSVEEILKIVKRDSRYWGDNGGITLTGGEPFLQAEFVTLLIKSCKELKIHTAVETCGFVPFENYIESLNYLDWIFFDLKNMDQKKHKEGTKVDNKLILENARKISEKFSGELVFRMVVISGYNDSKEHTIKLAQFLSTLPRNQIKINLLPLHHLGREKYNMLGLKYLAKNFYTPKNEVLNKIKKTLNSFNIECFIKSDTPF